MSQSQTAPGADVVTLLATGEQALDAGDVKTARAVAQRGIELAPDRAEAHLLLGRVREARGEFRAARASFRQALRLRPDYPAALDQLACLTAMVGSTRARREAYAYLRARIADGELPAVVLPLSADDAVRHRIKSLSYLAGYLGLAIALFVLAYGWDEGFDPPSVVVPLGGAGLVVAAYVWWLFRLLRPMPPEARRHLRGHHRREPLESLAVAGYSFSVLVVLSIPLWWFTTPMAAIVACIAAAAAPIATGAVVAGIALGSGTGRAGRILLSLGSQLHIAPLALVVALITALVLAFRSRRRGRRRTAAR